ncbi:MAG: glycosyltransferase family 4 protein [Candidatus Hydrogenedentes bacterium]|nr:glycosyltransferase family 4 protein [Candidatus Hydrogenedentota bacterium]
MLAVLNALQAGNRSGTGMYAARLAEWLAQVEGEPDVAVIWPEGLPRRHSAYHVHEAILTRPARPAIRRLIYDQWGIYGDVRRLLANLVHYPANIGSLRSLHNMVLTVHDLSFLRDPSWFAFSRTTYYRRAVARSVKLATHIIADSESTATDLQDLLRIPAKKISVVPLGVGERFQPSSDECVATIREKYKLPDRFFLYMGTLEPRKNLVRLIQAWSRVAHDLPYDLVLAGRNGWKTEPIFSEAAQSTHRPRIRFLGFVPEDDRPVMMSAAHAFVWPSLWEGFGLPPLEAMACGVPVLTSKVSSLPEVVGDGAILVDPANVEQIAHALVVIATDEALRASLREKGRARAAQFTWKKTAELTKRVYRSVLGVE